MENLEPTRADILSAWADTGPVQTYRAVLGSDWAARLQRSVPTHMHEGMVRWIVLGQRPGGFLTAVLENNLKEAVMRADDINARMLADTVGFLYSCAPPMCWGSPEKVKAWTGLLPEEVQP